MSSHTISMTETLESYLYTNSVRDLPVLAKLRKKTKTMTGAEMQISPEQGQFMQVLLQSLAAKRVLELGTFTGYSALVMALALPEDGYVLTCDVSPETTQIAKRYWQEANMHHKIELRLGPALTSLDALIQAKCQPFDFVFIDADKGNYPHYYEKSLSLLRVGGMIAIDNVLWGGSVAEPVKTDERASIIHDLNVSIHRDKRVNACIVPIGDGLTLAVKLGCVSKLARAAKN